MGMAASQARYLALVARKSNCEFEGQQINQARTVLSNQSANLFNQMLGLNVPVPPSTQDYTKTQYSFSDGINSCTIDSWNQLATPEEDYNYVINYHYNADVYTGSQKKMNDPQVQFSGSIPTDSTLYSVQVAAIQMAQTKITDAQKAYDDKFAEYKTKLSEASKLQNYADNTTNSNILDHTIGTDGKYTVTLQDKTTDGYPIFTASDGTEIYQKDDGKYYIAADNTEYTGSTDNMTAKANGTPKVYTPYADLTDQTDIANAIEQLKEYGALGSDFDSKNIYYDETNKTIAFKDDLDALLSSGGSGTKTILPTLIILMANQKMQLGNQ